MMTRKEVLQNIGARILSIRNSLRINKAEMANKMGISASSYFKNEAGQNCPDVMTLRIFAEQINLSLDWLILGRGDQVYKSPEDIKKQVAEEIQLAQNAQVASESPQVPENEDLRQDVKELIQHMDNIPLLRYEVLTMFHKFKENKKNMVAEAMKTENE
jgi:transcriptional regulator with XRE-family HTH domain